MNRRQFLKTLNALALTGFAGSLPGLTLFPTRVRANTGTSFRPKRFFLMIRATGGWDVTLGLDPKVHLNGSDQEDMFIEYRPDEIFHSGLLSLAPACAPIFPYASDMAVINGVFMSDANVSHEANLDYLTTGNSLGFAPDLAVEIATASSPGPFGVIFNETLKRGNRNVPPTTTDNLLSLKSSIDLAKIQTFFGTPSGSSDFSQSQRDLAINGPTRSILAKYLDDLNDEIETSPLSDDLSNGRLAGIMAAAFASGAAAQAQLDLEGLDLDTHSSHPKKHMESQKKAWAAVANIFRLFKEVELRGDDNTSLGSLFDHTTFMVISEFSRTPNLNTAKGKDHNPLTNSVLLAGAGIRGQSTIGKSSLITRKNTANGSSRFVASPIDYATGASPANKNDARNANFQYIFPENVISTVVEAMGIDRARFGNIESNTLALKGLIRRT